MKYVDFIPLKHSNELRRESIWTFDIETKDGLLGKEIYCWGLSTSKGGANFERKVYQNYTIEEFFKLLSELNNPKKKQSIYIHNLGFDCRFLIDYAIKNGINFLPIIIGSSCILLYINGFNYRFIDSFQFLLTSQENAEKDWEIDSALTKIDCKDLFNKNYNDWNELDKIRMLNHNKNDILALQSILEKFRLTYFEIANVDLLQANSLAGLSMKVFRKCMHTTYVNPFIWQIFDSKKKKFTYKINYDKADFCRKAYFGGRTECFSHKIVENCYYIDKVSMFPYHMYSKIYPNGIPYWENDRIKILESLNSKLSIIEAKLIPNINCKYPVLPIKIDERICFSNVTTNGIWTSIEIKKAISLGYGIIPVRALIFPSRCRPFRKFVKKFFKLKSISKGGKRNTAKITLNGCYGKFGQKFDNESTKLYVFESEIESIDFLNDSIDNETNENEINAYNYFNEFYQRWIVERKEKMQIIKSFQIISIACFITAYSRIDLLDGIEKIEESENDLHYCDTDSIVTNDLSGLKLGKNLGNWDIEAHFSQFYAIAPKCYIAQYSDSTINKEELRGKFLLKVKGIRKTKIKEIVESCKTLLEIKDMISREIELPEQYLPIKSSLRLEKKALSSRSMIKQMSLKDEKRITLLDLTTRPINDNDLFDLGIELNSESE